MIKDVLMEIIKEQLGSSDSFFKSTLPTAQLVNLLFTFVEDLSNWFHANGSGLSKSQITTTMKDVKDYLVISTTPTKKLINDFDEETKTSFIEVLRSRVDDIEAYDFLKNLTSSFTESLKETTNESTHPPSEPVKQEPSFFANFFNW